MQASTTNQTAAESSGLNFVIPDAILNAGESNALYFVVPDAILNVDESILLFSMVSMPYFIAQ